MSWHPSDLVNDADLMAYERTILTQFAVKDWEAKRAKTLEDWLKPQMAEHGFAPERFRTRFVADQAFGVTGGTATDVGTALANTTADDLNLETTLAASTDYLALGSHQQFRGLSLRMLDAINTAAATLTVELWQDAWRALTVTNTTEAAIGKPFSRGGSITWTVPSDWVIRPLHGSTPLYWARIRLSAAPTGAKFGQVSVIRRSVFSAPATMRTLAMIMREAPVSHKSPWIEKANFYEVEAQLALQRAWPLAGGEFDLTTPPDDVIDAEESARTSDEAGSPFRWERA